MVSWSPYHSADILRIETVQRRFTKRLTGFKHTSYITRCNSLNIETLELRRMRCDLLFTYKILFGLVDVVAADLFTLVNSGYNTRGYHINCRITIVASTVANISFLRVIKPWKRPTSTAI